MARHGVNMVWLIGCLETTPRSPDPDTRCAVATATLVTRGQAFGKQRGPERIEHHNLQASGVLAEQLGQLSVGAELFVEGSLHASQLDGERLLDQPNVIELSALEILFEPFDGWDGSRQSSEPTPASANQPPASAPASVHARDDAEPDENEVSPPPTQVIRPG